MIIICYFLLMTLLCNQKPKSIIAIVKILKVSIKKLTVTRGEGVWDSEGKKGKGQAKEHG